MQGSDINTDNLTVAFFDDSAVIRVEGRGSFKISPALKQFIHKMIRNKAASMVYLDMAACIGMDSTFMGVLAGLSSFTKNNGAIGLRLINLSDKNHRLLATLGVDKVVEYTLAGSTVGLPEVPPSLNNAMALPSEIKDKLEAAQTALEAHETLVEINPENHSKFKSVLEYLQNDVKNLSS